MADGDSDFSDFDCDFVSGAASRTQRLVEASKTSPLVARSRLVASSSQKTVSPAKPVNASPKRVEPGIESECLDDSIVLLSPEEPSDRHKDAAGATAVPTGHRSRDRTRNGRGRGGTTAKRSDQRSKKTLAALKNLDAVAAMCLESANAVEDGGLNGSTEVVPDDSLDDEIVVKIRWRYEVVRVKGSRSTPLSHIFDQFRSQLGPEVSGGTQFEFYLDSGDKLLVSDTCLSKGIDVTSILEARRSLRQSKDGDVSSDEDDEDGMVELKLQTRETNHRNLCQVIKVQPTDRMAVVMQRFAEKSGKDLSSLRFVFDGDPLDPDETPHSLGLEGGECIDVHLDVDLRQQQQPIARVDEVVTLSSDDDDDHPMVRAVSGSIRRSTRIRAATPPALIPRIFRQIANLISGSDVSAGGGGRGRTSNRGNRRGNGGHRHPGEHHHGQVGNCTGPGSHDRGRAATTTIPSARGSFPGQRGRSGLSSAVNAEVRRGHHHPGVGNVHNYNVEQPQLVPAARGRARGRGARGRSSYRGAQQPT